MFLHVYLQTQPLGDPLTPGSMLDALAEVQDIDLNADDNDDDKPVIITPQVGPAGDAPVPAPPAEVTLHLPLHYTSLWQCCTENNSGVCQEQCSTLLLLFCSLLTDLYLICSIH